MQNDIYFKLLSPDWSKHLPKVLQRKEEEDESSSTESEKEEKEISDEPNHDPCGDFEFDEMGRRVNKFPYEDHVRKFVKRGDVCMNMFLPSIISSILFFLSSHNFSLFFFFIFFCFSYFYNGSYSTF
jgi:hypothetical protein